MFQALGESVVNKMNKMQPPISSGLGEECVPRTDC